MQRRITLTKKEKDMTSPIVPPLLSIFLSPTLLAAKRAVAEKKRKLKKSPHLVRVYLRLNDASSYLLLQVLKDLGERYPIEYEFRTILNLQSEMYPSPSLWEKNAFSDGQYLANLYSLDFPSQPPESSPERDVQLTAQLLHWELQPGYLDNALQLFHAYWNDDKTQIKRIVDNDICLHSECYQHHMKQNENLLKESGNYLTAMLHYGGEWYWGLDRLEHLEQRLNKMGLNQKQTQTVLFNKSYQQSCERKQLIAQKDLSTQALSASKHSALKNSALTPIELFWSIRSPYSYLGLVQAIQLAEQYQIPLVVKPVLPMVMRRMEVPKNKRFYIITDSKREADKHGIKFGKLADPLGAGVERCYALFDYASSEGKANAYLESYARGVWSEGIRSETDSGIKTIIERVGLSWEKAKPLLQQDSWRVWAQRNLAELYANDQWGVPSIKYGNLAVFGQDRIDRIEQAITENINANEKTPTFETQFET